MKLLDNVSDAVFYKWLFLTTALALMIVSGAALQTLMYTRNLYNQALIQDNASFNALYSQCR